MSRCGVIILAAGGSSRLGKPKQLLELQGRTLLHRAIDTAMASRCGPIFVVLGAHYAPLAEPLKQMPLTVVHNPKWALGIGTSIRAGIAAAQAQCDAAMLMLCDQPFITAGEIDALLEQLAASGKRICAAAYNGTLGTPSIFSSVLFPELLALADDEGGKAVIRRYIGEVASVDIPAAAMDIDTEGDFTRATTANPDSTPPGFRR